MLLPIRTDRRLSRTPLVNYGLIAVNVLLFLLTAQQVQAAASHASLPVSQAELMHRYPILKYYLDPLRPQLHQFISYPFLHAGWMHLLGNMIFLYLFGSSVEDRLGRVGYLAFYLAGGVLSGLGHAMLEPNSVLGASGAVAGVTGAYLALFPLSNVTVVYWFFVVGVLEVSSLVLIGFQIAQNVVSQAMGLAGVAYLAHLSGYAYGFAVGMALLGTRLLAREPYDLFSLLAQRRRRAKFRALSRQGYQPWRHEAGREQEAGPLSQAEQELAALRARIGQELARHDPAAAAKLYEQLLELDDRQTLIESAQLDVANQLMAEAHHERAAHAYELFLLRYGSTYPRREQVQLILGLIYTRYLHRPERAAELLREAVTLLQSPEQRSLAEAALRKLEADQPR